MTSRQVRRANARQQRKINNYKKVWGPRSSHGATVKSFWKRGRDRIKPNKYPRPHQGKQEIARRLAKL